MKMDLLNTSQAAAAMGITLSAVQKLIARGRLPAQRLGRDWFIDRKHVERFERIKPGRPANVPK